MKQYRAAIIGGGLSGLTTAYYLSKRGVSCVVVESTERLGGMIESFSESGFTYESGPNTGVIGNIEVVELFKELSGECEVLPARSEAKRRLILKGGTLHELPSGLCSGVRTPLFKFSDKLRVLGEPFRAKGKNSEESVADMVRRRLGGSILDYAVDPFIGGIYAGDPEKLVTRYALPKLHNLEQNYGSFIRGTIKRGKLAKADRAAGISKEIFSTSGGLCQLTQALEKNIKKNGGEFILGHSATVNPLKEGGYSIVAGEKRIEAESVISTVPGYELESVMPFIESDTMEKITSLEYAGVVQVAVGYNSLSEKMRSGQINSFGALFPFKEGSKVLGILFPSSCFEGKAPKEGALLSIFIGGARHKEIFEMNDKQIEELARLEIAFKLGIKKKPDLLKIFRHPRAIAQYEKSSGARFEAIKEIEAKYSGLLLGGGIRDGIGMADRIKQAKLLSNSVL
ncbi:MAG: protoporphyrinogen oxidase [Rikenellaceae bacterium]